MCFIIERHCQPHPLSIQSTPKLRLKEVDQSIDLRMKLHTQAGRSRQRQESLQTQVRRLTSELEEQTFNHRQELGRQLQFFTSKFDEQAQAHAVERAAEIEHLRKELEAQKAKMGNFKASSP